MTINAPLTDPTSTRLTFLLMYLNSLFSRVRSENPNNSIARRDYPSVISGYVTSFFACRSLSFSLSLYGDIRSAFELSSRVCFYAPALSRESRLTRFLFLPPFITLLAGSVNGIVVRYTRECASATTRGATKRFVINYTGRLAHREISSRHRHVVDFSSPSLYGRVTVFLFFFLSFN